MRYYWKLENSSFILNILYVDDILIEAKNSKEVQQLKNQLRQEFNMKDLGGARKILSMEIKLNCIQQAVAIAEDIHTSYYKTI